MPRFPLPPALPFLTLTGYIYAISPRGEREGGGGGGGEMDDEDDDDDDDDTPSFFFFRFPLAFLHTACREEKRYEMKRGDIPLSEGQPGRTPRNELEEKQSRRDQ